MSDIVAAALPMPPKDEINQPPKSGPAEARIREPSKTRDIAEPLTLVGKSSGKYMVNQENWPVVKNPFAAAAIKRAGRSVTNRNKDREKTREPR
jgi:hypothetical protein